MYGLAQLDIGLSQVGARGRLIPVGFSAVEAVLSETAHAALRVLFPFWRTIPTPWLWWLAGLYLRYLLDREGYRWRNRVQTLPPDHPLGEGYRLPRTKAGVVCIRQLKASNQALSGSHVIRSLELSSDFPQPRPGRTKSRLRIWSRGGGPINHNLASGTALRPNLSSSCLIGGASLGGLPRHQDMVTSSSTTSGSTTRRVRSKLALAARQIQRPLPPVPPLLP